MSSYDDNDGDYTAKPSYVGLAVIQGCSAYGYQCL